ncbi:DUF2975 domain-containing protein [Mucilaginibacter roseus]|uniref:DUF2975 domain-containing protein n=1 Tax=Mucilaginibacter roseus TaxID=1528868 RepID=A0ABS8U047_9SPHI|nr:DUF2975 domain-containing protein [Mucilaginibacter roseus]MCD8739304.1 DUF2975 domain-containing protein [Mucilaginibacter roseus]
MKTVRLIAKVLSAISKILATGYFLSFLLSIIAFTTGWNLNVIEHNTRFEICYPFTQTPFLLGEYSAGYMLMFLLLLGLYSLFFLLVGRVFGVFTQARLFTAHGIRQLKMFYLGNLVLPVVAIVVVSLFYNVDSPAEILVVLHMLLGVFTYFMAAIFREGYNLQCENDLIL